MQVREIRMDQTGQIAYHIAHRILESDYDAAGLTPNSQLLLDLAEMVRQQIRGEKLLGEKNSRFLRAEPGSRQLTLRM